MECVLNAHQEVYLMVNNAQFLVNQDKYGMEGDVNHYVEEQWIVFGMEYNVFVMTDSLN